MLKFELVFLLEPDLRGSKHHAFALALFIDIHPGIDWMATRTKEFLETLNNVAADKIGIDIYKANLNVAIEGTRDALNDVEKAMKNVAPPVRRAWRLCLPVVVFFFVLCTAPFGSTCAAK
jgi:hypothetical protein